MNGDGVISVLGYTQVCMHIRGLANIRGVYRLAADVNADGAIFVSDYTLMRFRYTWVDKHKLMQIEDFCLGG